jgi:uncharacterized protein
VSVFLDTSALLPLLVSNDPDHPAVLAAFRALLDDGRHLVTTSYVVVETSAVLQNRIGTAPVLALHDRVLPLVEVEHVDAGLHRDGLERLRRESRRRLSLVDCVSFECMQRNNVRDALALDADFRDAGFRLQP